MKILSPQTCLLLTSVFAAGCTNLSESRFLVPKDEEPDMKSAVIMEEPDSRPDMPEEEDMRPELDMRDDGKCTRVSDCKTDLPNVVASCDSNGHCNYQCVMGEEQTWAVIQNQVIDVNGCNCEVLPEICNGEDEDCDGVPDNGADIECQQQDGVCSGATNPCKGKLDESSHLCSDELYREHATRSGFFFSDNIYESHRCDGLDNNCDGRIDEACCVDGIPPKQTVLTGNANEVWHSLLSHPEDANSFVVFGAREHTRMASSLLQTVENETSPSYDTDYARGQLYWIGETVKPVTTGVARSSLQQSAVILNQTLHQLIANDPEIRFLFLRSFVNNSQEDPTLVPLNWLPAANQTDEVRENPSPIIEASSTSALIGGWVNKGSSTSRSTEFRACVGQAFEQDCTTHSFTLDNGHTTPPPTALTALQGSEKFFLIYPLPNEKLLYTVFDLTAQQPQNQREAQIPAFSSGDRHLSRLVAKWVSPDRVLVAQHAWYPSINSNRLELAILDTSPSAPTPVIASTSLPLESTSNVPIELALSETSDNISQRFVLTWSENGRAIHTVPIKIPKAQNTLNLLPRREITRLSPGDSTLTLSGTAYNGRHLALLVTEANTNVPDAAGDFVFFTSPEGVPFCDIEQAAEEDQ